MSSYHQRADSLAGRRRTWLVTGVAGFIGSHLLHRLLRLGQNVIGLDNFSTGSRRNLEEVQDLVPAGAWARFQLVSGDLRVFRTCQLACRGADFVLHQAALGSVPRSLRQPRRYLANNVGGFLNLIQAAREAGVARFVYASSSSVYGNSPILPRIEHSLGQPLSPYALTKVMNETCASLYASAYGFPSIGLRYFNVFGPRRCSTGVRFRSMGMARAAVIFATSRMSWRRMCWRRP
jgi:UDP-N-acetylglucosamine 4-epimerase